MEAVPPSQKSFSVTDLMLPLDENILTFENYTTLLSSLAPNATFAADLAEDEGWTFPKSFEFLVHGVLLCITGVLGLFGNLICIVILSRPQMKSSINTMLTGLVSCDSILIVTSLLLFSFTDFRHTGNAFFSHYYWEVYPYILPAVYPIGLMAQTGSAYMTLGVTIERYLVVCWPLKARSVCTNGRAKMAVLTFATFAVIYNIPRFLEVTVHTKYIKSEAANKTVFVPTELRKNPTYASIYVTWMYLVFMYIIPFTSLAVLNLRIFLSIRKANATRAILSNQEKKDHNLAMMLLVVVFVFFTCNLLPLLINILELIDIRMQEMIQVSNLLVTINSSVNILIYCTFGNKFKTIFMQIFCGKKPRVQTMRTGFEHRRSQQQYETPTSIRATIFTAIDDANSNGGSGGGGGGAAPAASATAAGTARALQKNGSAGTAVTLVAKASASASSASAAAAASPAGSTPNAAGSSPPQRLLSPSSGAEGGGSAASGSGSGSGVLKVELLEFNDTCCGRTHAQRAKNGRELSLKNRRGIV